MDSSLASLLHPWDSLDKNTGVGCPGAKKFGDCWSRDIPSVVSPKSYNSLVETLWPSFRNYHLCHNVSNILATNSHQVHKMRQIIGHSGRSACTVPWSYCRALCLFRSHPKLDVFCLPANSPEHIPRCEISISSTRRGPPEIVLPSLW